VAAALGRILPSVLVVGKDLGLLGRACPQARLAQDLHREGHPLGGILTGLRVMETSYAFVCACDMPLVKPALVAGL
jgi:molybdopterin-guanine dinucleotide biosynthesis protein A